MNNAQREYSAAAQTRQQLILAAERLFAESGIDGVSLRQINLAAGQKNSSAAHYHFGSKETLIMAIYAHRMARVNERRNAALDDIESANRQTNLRDLAGAIVLPIVEEIEADDSGRNYIRFMAQAMGHPQLDLAELWQQENGSGLARTVAWLRQALPDMPAQILGQRFGLAFEQIVHCLADRERLRSSGGQDLEIDTSLFVNNLIDCVSGAMAAPVSDATLRDLEQLR